VQPVGLAWSDQHATQAILSLSPLRVLAVALLPPAAPGIPYALIWLAHIGFDRMLGYGLKYPTFFEDTHLQHV
jgi:hypothetical protein